MGERFGEAKEALPPCPSWQDTIRSRRSGASAAGEGEFGHGKPDERVYRHVLAELDVEASDAMMVGDDLERDVAGPQKVGMRGVWIDRAGAGLPPGTMVRPDRIIGSLADLL